jgi:hypothetical protein
VEEVEAVGRGVSDSDTGTDSFGEHLLRVHQQVYQDYDKAIMSLAGGALAISLVFIHDVAPDPTHRWAIAISWGFLTGSLLLVIGSFLASQWTIERALERRYGQEDEDEQAEIRRRKRATRSPNWRRKSATCRASFSLSLTTWPA